MSAIMKYNTHNNGPPTAPSSQELLTQKPKRKLNRKSFPKVLLYKGLKQCDLACKSFKTPAISPSQNKPK